MRTPTLQGSLILALVFLTTAPAVGQVPSNSRYGNGQRMPLSPRPPTGEPVAPFFEGWYRNDDGTFTLSFGYFNLNTEQVLDIPHGPDNNLEPAEFNGLQPTHFPSSPRRDRGVFQVTVPAEWEDDEEQRVVWTITANGVPHSVPGRVGYEALQLDYAPRAMGSLAPIVRILPDGPEGQQIRGVRSEPRTATVGTPLPLALLAREVSVRAPEDQVNTNVEMEVTWFKFQGPGAAVVFDPDSSIVIENGEGEAMSTATFSEAGDYVLRARVDNWDANDSSGGDQCCWTNAYVPVTVSPGGGGE